jgi:hypothetical protein
MHLCSLFQFQLNTSSCGKTWTFWVDIGPDPKTGERKQISKGRFKTRKDAEDAVAALIAEVQKGTFIKESDILFKDFAEQWLPSIFVISL